MNYIKIIFVIFLLFFSVMEKSFSNIKDGKQFNKFVLNFANQKLKNKFDKKLINSFIKVIYLEIYLQHFLSYLKKK